MFTLGALSFLLEEITFVEGDWCVGDQNRKLPLPPTPPFVNDRKSTENLYLTLFLLFYHFCTFSKNSLAEMVSNYKLIIGNAFTVQSFFFCNDTVS